MREPEDTCPLIDSSIDDLQGYIATYLEDLRAANSELREWGHYWKDTHSDLEDKYYDLEHEFDKLQSEYDELEEKYNDLLSSNNEEDE